MKFASTLLAVVALSALAGCGPTPAKVCEKLKELDALPVGGQTGCEIKWGKAKQENAEKYTKEAECVLGAADKKAVQACFK